MLKTEGARALAEAGRAAMAQGGLSFCGLAHHNRPPCGPMGPYKNERQLIVTVTEGVIEVRARATMPQRCQWHSDDDVATVAPEGMSRIFPCNRDHVGL